MIASALFPAISASYGDVPRLEDRNSPASQRRERIVREFVGDVVRASGAGFRRRSLDVLVPSDPVGGFLFVDASHPRFAMLSFEKIGATIHTDGSLKFLSKSWSELPKDARRWTEAECREAARGTVSALLPAAFRVRSVELSPMGDLAYDAVVDVVSQVDSRALVKRLKFLVDTATGMPRSAELSKQWPEISNDRVTPIVSDEESFATALGIYRRMKPFALAARVTGEFIYEPPFFTGMVHEMTEEHRRLEAAGLSTAMYRLEVHDAERRHALQYVWVDARTGRGIAWVDPTIAGLSGGKKMPAGFDVRATWTLGTSSGRLNPVDEVASPGSIHVLRSEDGKLLRVLFDSDTGLVQALGGTYRPDAALLEAMRAEKPGRPFGKR